MEDVITRVLKLTREKTNCWNCTSERDAVDGKFFSKWKKIIAYLFAIILAGEARTECHTSRGKQRRMHIREYCIRDVRGEEVGGGNSNRNPRMKGTMSPEYVLENAHSSSLVHYSWMG
jgi:hypothetical protein